MGDFYQISNQITLAKSEEQLINEIRDVVPNIISYERRVRNALVKENRQSLHDTVSRAYGTLKSAQTISSEETMHLLSSVRMGINLGLIDDLQIPTVNELFIHTQPAHLQKLRREHLKIGRTQRCPGHLSSPTALKRPAAEARLISRTRRHENATPPPACP